MKQIEKKLLDMTIEMRKLLHDAEDIDTLTFLWDFGKELSIVSSSKIQNICIEKEAKL